MKHIIIYLAIALVMFGLLDGTSHSRRICSPRHCKPS